VSDAEICGVELGFNLLLAFALGSSKRAQSKKTVTDMKTFKLINTGKSYSLGLSSVIVLALIISIFQFVTFSEASPGAPNPGHSVSEIGSGVFGEKGFMLFREQVRLVSGQLPQVISWMFEVREDLQIQSR